MDLSDFALELPPQAASDQAHHQRADKGDGLAEGR